jgi:hypothetical protein
MFEQDAFDDFVSVRGEVQLVTDLGVFSPFKVEDSSWAPSACRRPIESSRSVKPPRSECCVPSLSKWASSRSPHVSAPISRSFLLRDLTVSRSRDLHRAVGFLDPTLDLLRLVFGHAFYDRSRAVKELGQLGTDAVSSGDLFDDSRHLAF